MNSAAESYLEMVEEETARQGLLACSSALRLDDGIARDLIKRVTQSNGSTESLLRRIKRLGCVWEQGDGSWFIAEDVRSAFLDRLHEEVSDTVINDLRSRLAAHALERASDSPDGQITAYRNRQAQFEAAYQRTLIPDHADEGASELAEIWHAAPESAAQATVESVEYLAEEIDRHVGNLPDGILFLRGLAARDRGDEEKQIRYFGAVRRNGQKGDIYGIAAHFYGLVIDNQSEAERAFRDSIDWNTNPSHRGKVWHSLGNLLSDNPDRWDEAEDAYEKSLDLLDDPTDLAQVWHSLGNLLSDNPDRWDEAEEAYEQSLQLLDNPTDLAQVWHSFGNLLSDNPDRWDEAENAYEKSLNLESDPLGRGQVLHSLGNLLSDNPDRWDEAEEAYERSLQLLDNPEHQAQVYSSWANALSNQNPTDKEYDKIENLSLKIRELSSSPKSRGISYRILSDVYDYKGNINKQIQALEGLYIMDKKLDNEEYRKRTLSKIIKLRRKHNI